MKKQLLFFILALPFFGNAQFICDYSINTQLSNSEYEQVLPKIITLGNNNSYITWFEADADTYSVKLQLIDSQGNKLWGNDLTVSNHTTDTWITDYSINVDNENNCIIAFNDWRNETQDVTVYKISETGEFLWGNDGITLSDASSDDYFPHVIVNSQNEAIFAWSNYNSVITLQKLSSEGVKMWGENGIIFQDEIPTVRYNNPIILNSDEDFFFLIWTHETGSFMYPIKNIYLQKLNSDGEITLEEPTIIYDAEQIPIYVAPKAVCDNLFGTYITWYSFQNSVLNSFVSHVDSPGQLTFPVNGVAVENNSNQMSVMPTLAVDNQNNVSVFWKQSDLNQTYFSVYGQKFNSLGEIFWDENGIEYIPFSTNNVLEISASDVNDKFLLFILDNFIENTIDSKNTSYLINSEGGVINSKIVSDYESAKVDFSFSKVFNNQIFTAWSDERSGTKNLYIQNIYTFDIDLGNDTTITTDQFLTLDAGEGFASYLWNDETIEETLEIDASNYPIGEYEFFITALDECNFEYSDTIIVNIINPINVIETEKKFNIYPNPFENLLNIINNTSSNFEVEIFDISGSKYFSGNNFLEINTENFEKGIYFVKIKTENKIFNYKIIKK